MTAPARSSELVCVWSALCRSKQSSPANGASAGRAQVASESALTALRVVRFSKPDSRIENATEHERVLLHVLCRTLDQLRATNHKARLWPTEKFVAAKRDNIGAGLD